MKASGGKRQALRSWLYLSVLVILAAVLGALQYRWIAEVSLAERERLRASLRASLQRLSQDFNAELASAYTAVLVGNHPDGEEERDEAYALHYSQWKESSRHSRLIRQFYLARPKGDKVELRRLDADTGVFSVAEWPTAWNAAREQLASLMTGGPQGLRRGPGGPLEFEEDDLAMIPAPRTQRFERGGFPPPEPPVRRDRPEVFVRMEQEWLLFGLDLDYVRASLIPELLQRHLGGSGKVDYQVEVVSRADPSKLIYSTPGEGTGRIGSYADASVGLFEVQFEVIFRRGGIFRGRDGRPGLGKGRPPMPEMPMPNRGRWLLSVRHHAGSLDAVVEKARWRNLAVTGAILGLMMAAIGALVQYTNRAQKLAHLQMEFVAGVSHELRTPLSVIRTAAHNLGQGVVTAPKQVERYGALIEDETKRLTGIVEQVLRFASAKAGRPIGAREPVTVQSLVEDALAATSAVIEESRCSLETRVDPELPPILADPIALKHAIQNLLINAAKYGSEGGWIGLTASKAPDGKEPGIEIRVADRGPGISADELGQIFDPFYRGKKAIENQIHGTGLGLNLVKRIVEAHEGTVTVESEPGKGTEFVLRIPAKPAVETDEFANTASRG